MATAAGTAATATPAAAGGEDTQTEGRAKSAPATRLVVLALPLAAKRVDPALAQSLDDLLASELAKRDYLKVTTLADIDALLQEERLKDVLGCDDVSCAAEISGAIGADRILAGSLANFGDRYVLTLRWLDAVYNQPLAHVSDEISESDALTATRRVVGTLLNDSQTVDATARSRKQAPTFWTLELSVGPDLISAPEPYNSEIQGTIRLAWGGQPRDVPIYFYLLGGFGFDYLSGGKDGPTGKISYSRTLLNPFAELRLALPIAFRSRTRLYAGVGAGLDVEFFSALQAGGQEPAGTQIFPEVRAVAGLWHRWHHGHSAWVGYRLRVLFRGDGADSVSELVRMGSSTESFWLHAIEIGWAFHF